MGLLDVDGAPSLDEGDEEAPAWLTYSKLRLLNLLAGCLHLLVAVLFLGASLNVEDLENFRLRASVSYLELNDTNPDQEFLFTKVEQLGSYKWAWTPSIFSFLSAIFHFLVILPRFNDVYNKFLTEGMNPFRWIEYTLSASVMLVQIAQLFGVTDVATWLLIGGGNSTTMLCGLLMEERNRGGVKEDVNWLPFWVGCWASIWPWVAIMMYFFLDSGGAPAFVIAILWTYFVFFAFFPINMALQYKRIGPWRSYLVGELGYIILSFTAKTVLIALVFGG